MIEEIIFFLFSVLYFLLFMNLEKLFWSRTKTDILKFLVFRRQGVSVRAFETELTRSFPAIKKQVDQLDEAWVIDVQKDNNKRSIYLKKGIDEHIRNVFLYTLKQDLLDYFHTVHKHVDKYYLGDMFGYEFDMDIVIIHEASGKELTPEIKDKVTRIFAHYHTDTVKLVFMSSDEFQKRVRLTDKFVLTMMTNAKEVEVK